MSEHPCAARERRAGMTDDEFWQDVADSITVAPGESDLADYLEDRHHNPDVDVALATGTPCPECDAEGACAWDAEGRPLIHAVNGDDR